MYPHPRVSDRLQTQARTARVHPFPALHAGDMLALPVTEQLADRGRLN